MRVPGKHIAAKAPRCFARTQNAPVHLQISNPLRRWRGIAKGTRTVDTSYDQLAFARGRIFCTPGSEVAERTRAKEGLSQFARIGSYERRFDAEGFSSINWLSGTIPFADELTGHPEIDGPRIRAQLSNQPADQALYATFQDLYKTGFAHAPIVELFLGTLPRLYWLEKKQKGEPFGGSIAAFVTEMHNRFTRGEAQFVKEHNKWLEERGHDLYQHHFDGLPRIEGGGHLPKLKVENLSKTSPFRPLFETQTKETPHLSGEIGHGEHVGLIDAPTGERIVTHFFENLTWYKLQRYLAETGGESLNERMIVHQGIPLEQGFANLKSRLQTWASRFGDLGSEAMSAFYEVIKGYFEIAQAPDLKTQENAFADVVVNQLITRGGISHLESDLLSAYAKATGTAVPLPHVLIDWLKKNLDPEIRAAFREDLKSGLTAQGVYLSEPAFTRAFEYLGEKVAKAWVVRHFRNRPVRDYKGPSPVFERKFRRIDRGLTLAAFREEVESTLRNPQNRQHTVNEATRLIAAARLEDWNTDHFLRELEVSAKERNFPADLAQELREFFTSLCQRDRAFADRIVLTLFGIGNSVQPNLPDCLDGIAREHRTIQADRSPGRLSILEQMRQFRDGETHLPYQKEIGTGRSTLLEKPADPAQGNDTPSDPALKNWKDRLYLAWQRLAQRLRVRSDTQSPTGFRPRLKAAALREALHAVFFSDREGMVLVQSDGLSNQRAKVEELLFFSPVSVNPYEPISDPQAPDAEGWRVLVGIHNHPYGSAIASMADAQVTAQAKYPFSLVISPAQKGLKNRVSFFRVNEKGVYEEIDPEIELADGSLCTKGREWISNELKKLEAQFIRRAISPRNGSPAAEATRALLRARFGNPSSQSPVRA